MVSSKETKLNNFIQWYKFVSPDQTALLVVSMSLNSLSCHKESFSDENLITQLPNPTI